MHVADRRVKEDAADPRQDRVADPAVRPRHRARGDAAKESVPDDEVVAAPQPIDERTDGAEVVAGVGVAHDHEVPIGGFDPTDQRVAVATPRHLDHARAELLRDHNRPVGAAVVGDDDLAVETSGFERPLRALDAGGERLGLVQARHDDRDLDASGGGDLGAGDVTRGDLHRHAKPNEGEWVFFQK